MNEELVERVAAAIAEIRELPVEGGTVPVEFGPQSAAIIATAAVRAVRKYDVEHGPSLEERLAAIYAQDEHGGIIDPILKAAAVERARGEGVG